MTAKLNRCPICNSEVYLHVTFDSDLFIQCDKCKKQWRIGTKLIKNAESLWNEISINIVKNLNLFEYIQVVKPQLSISRDFEQERLSSEAHLLRHKLMELIADGKVK